VRLWDTPFWIGDREFTAADLALITETVREFKNLSRTELAATICEILPWKAPNGRVKVNGCMILLERMESAGLIVLPPKKTTSSGSICNLRFPPLPLVEIRCPLSRLRPITVEPVPYEENGVWNSTVATYHPMSFQRPFGAHQRYWIYGMAGGKRQVLGALLFAAPAKALADRDRWIGWTAAERRRFLYRIVGNSRFLILPGIEVPHLASHALGLVLRRLREDWRARYGYAPVLVETFVTPPRKGTCYRACNWIHVGESGVSDFSRKRRPEGPVRLIFIYRLVRNWREELYAPTPAAEDEDGVLDG